MAESLDGKIVAVTGASTGIGLQIAKLLASEGATLYLLGRPSARLDQAVESLGEKGHKCALDFADNFQIEQAIDSIVHAHQRLDILIANAGSFIDGDVLDNDPDAWDKMLDINVNATMKVIRAAIRHMKDQKSGDIVVTSSIAGAVDIIESPVYAASKHAIQSFVHTTRAQYAKYGIRMGAVLPGPVETPLLDDWDKERLEKVRASGTLTPEDIAESMHFMLTRPRHVVIRDLVILPSKTDRF